MSDFKPIKRMWDRYETAREESDTAAFHALLYLGEALTKTVAAGLVAGIEEDRDRTQYRQIYRLVRADGIGEWAQVIEHVLSGEASRQLSRLLADERLEFTTKCEPGSWQYEAVFKLEACIKSLGLESEQLAKKADLKRWFSRFAYLRNKTRGHGAPLEGVYSQACRPLQTSLSLISDHVRLFRLPWAYLHQSLAGHYRVTRISAVTGPFDVLKSKQEHAPQLRDGVYVYTEKPTEVRLMSSDSDASDFFYPNGGFDGTKFELLSYITGKKQEGDSGPYLTPPGDLPPSVTHGMGVLDPQGSGFGNLPPSPHSYINRPGLERELEQTLVDERHHVVTILGSGGIGKTSLALSVLHRVTRTERFGLYVWFSARDIDLFPDGPKAVQPSVVSMKDISREFARLLQPAGLSEPVFDHRAYFEASLGKCPYGAPCLFVFDNFETVRNPDEMYGWISTYVRLPNKVLITSRQRNFKGDYPIEVFGMSEPEANGLTDSTAGELGILPLINDDYRRVLFQESDGHPYVIKILLGEVSKTRKISKPERIVAGKEDILDALFERTYNGLSHVAKRVFLTLCNWRSVVPRLAFEAVMLRPAIERMDVSGAIDELRRSSLIQEIESEKDESLFLSVPLVASVFGRNKLKISPLKATVEADTEMLRILGAMQESEIRHGLAPKVDAIFRAVAERTDRNQSTLDDWLPVLEFIARKYPRAWLLIATRHEESRDRRANQKAKVAVQNYLEASDTGSEQRVAWRRYVRLCRHSHDVTGEIHGLNYLCSTAESPLDEIPSVVERLLDLFQQAPNFQLIEENRVILDQFLQTVDSAAASAEPEELARIANLCIKLKEIERARRFVMLGLKINSRNIQCRKLATQLNLR